MPGMSPPKPAVVVERFSSDRSSATGVSPVSSRRFDAHTNLGQGAAGRTLAPGDRSASQRHESGTGCIEEQDQIEIAWAQIGGGFRGQCWNQGQSIGELLFLCSQE